MHKRVCSEDPSIKPHVPIEMAIERALKRLPSQATAPADATCYICLDHDSKLVRGCACRGDSAGFAHLECLIEYAERNEEALCGRSFINCINCKQDFTGALQLQLVRRSWRRHRDESVESRLFVASSSLLGGLLEKYDERDAQKRLIDAVSHSSHSDKRHHKLKVAERMAKERPEEALQLIEEVLSQAKRDGDLAVTFFAQRAYMRAAQNLGRYDETIAMATECLESAKAYYGDSADPELIGRKHIALDVFAHSCGMIGRFDESKRAYDELIASCTRVFGCDHEFTDIFFMKRAQLLHKMVCKARDLVFRDDLANGARYLDAVLIESKARNFFDAKDPNVQINYKTMAVAANLLLAIGRIEEGLVVARLCLKSARERKDLDSKSNQHFMQIYAQVSYDLHGPTKESKQVLGELLAIQTRLYGPDAPETQETASLKVSLQQHLK